MKTQQSPVPQRRDFQSRCPRTRPRLRYCRSWPWTLAAVSSVNWLCRVIKCSIRFLDEAAFLNHITLRHTLHMGISYLSKCFETLKNWQLKCTSTRGVGEMTLYVRHKAIKQWTWFKFIYHKCRIRKLFPCSSQHIKMFQIQSRTFWFPIYCIYISNYICCSTVALDVVSWHHSCLRYHSTSAVRT